MRIAFATFGCKINQYETDCMREATLNDGNAVVPFDAKADVYVINTCSVTAKTDYQCRQAIRAAVRRGSGAQVIVTGCYAETRGDEIRNIPGVSAILPNQAKLDVTSYFSSERKPDSGLSLMARPALPVRTRTFLKIQDGCDSRCSYCIVPFARGGSRSVPKEKVTALFDAAVRQGAPEVVLSGIHIGRYGSDLVPHTTLSSLVAGLNERKGNTTRIRLSSIEPTEVTQELISMVGSGLCRHLHIPLQSGDDGILRKMNRQYDAGVYSGLLKGLAERVPGIAIGADVMVGFPGEGEREFQNTFDLIERLPVTHLHVFSFSPRPGTPASAMSGQVPDDIKKKRNELLRHLGLRKNFAFRGSLLGKEIPVVIESTKNEEREYIGISDNYIKVAVAGARAADIGKILPVKITAVEDQRTECVLV